MYATSPPNREAHCHNEMAVHRAYYLAEHYQHLPLWHHTEQKAPLIHHSQVEQRLLLPG